jgi:hypothetical protein
VSAWYPDFAEAIRAAGFFTNGIESCGTWERTTVCSIKLAGERGYSGNSFWVTRLGDHWYLGTWGVWLYRLPTGGNIVQLCIDWLTRVPRPTMADFDDQLKAEYALVPLTEAEFDSAVNE